MIFSKKRTKINIERQRGSSPPGNVILNNDPLMIRFEHFLLSLVLFGFKGKITVHSFMFECDRVTGGNHSFKVIWID